MDPWFSGKSVVITGAAFGVGAALARTLNERGAKVMLADSDETALKRMQEDVDPSKEKVQRFTCDLTQKFGVKNLLSATLDAFERVDVVITTPTVTERADPLTLSMEALDTVMTATLRSAFLVSQAAAARMVAQAEENPPEGETTQAGSIVHVSALAGRLSAPAAVADAVSFAALDQLTRSLAARLAPQKVRVNGVAPGGVLTEALKVQLRERPELRATLLSRTPLGRIGEAAEAAEAALFLASDKASFITGQTLVVDGGRSVLDPIAADNV